MTKKGYEVLKAVTKEFHGVIFSVISCRDANLQKDYYEEIKTHCASFGIPFYNRSESYEINSKYVIAISWRWLLFYPSTELIIFHDSLLPKYRGFSPLVTALINRERKVGVTALYASREYDKGDIISQLSIPLKYPIKIQQAIDLVISNYNKMALDIFKKVANDQNIQGEKQNEELATYSLWRDEDDYKINWSKTSDYIINFINAVGFPYKGAASILNGRVVRIFDAKSEKDVEIESRTPGKVIFFIDKKPVVVCGKGLIRINSIMDDQTRQSLLPMSKFRSRFE